MTENDKGDVNWSRFGLDPVGQGSPPRSHQDHSGPIASGSTACGNPNVKELFDEDQVSGKYQPCFFIYAENLSIS